MNQKSCDFLYGCMRCDFYTMVHNGIKLTDGLFATLHYCLKFDAPIDDIDKRIAVKKED